jgi:hypothetical protein
LFIRRKKKEEEEEEEERDLKTLRPTKRVRVLQLFKI